MIPMKSSRRLLALAMGALVAAGPAAAAKPAAKEAPAPVEQPAAPSGQANYGVKLGAFFNEQHKKAARTAFAQRYGKGKECPTGLERGSKGCAPPVEGRDWAVGQTLQPAVKPNPVPEVVKAKLPEPPAGYEYLLAGDDVLLVSKGLHLVVDMIEDVAG
jgi:Ni/Co efflux regulator RcnB